MRFAAQKTIGMQDMLPANGSIYMPNMDNKMTSMMDALKAWEKKRGLSFSFKGKFIAPKAKQEKDSKKVKETPAASRPVEVPQERRKPGRRPTLTKEERKERKNEWNRTYRKNHNAEACQRARDWRAKQSPEQKAKQLERVRVWKAAAKARKLAAANQGTGSGEAGLPLANAAVS
jgi:hypothetical protein